MWRFAMFVSLRVGCASAGTAADPASTGPAEPIGRLPFQVDRNRVILPVRVAGSEPLDLILDTGMGFDGVYLFHRGALEGLEGADLMEVRVPGAGSGEASTALMADSVTLSCGDMEFGGQRAIVSTSETTQGFPSDGIIGWTVLGHHVAELDYDRDTLSLYENGRWAPDSSWRRLDLTLKNNIPWIETALAIEGGEPVPAATYIDLAAGDAVVVLIGPGKKFSAPDDLEEKYLGTGLSGDVRGGIGKVSRLRIGPFDLFDVVAAFPPAEVRSKQQGADAILGGDAIRRFNVVFDYAAGGLYLEPSRFFAEPFTQ